MPYTAPPSRIKSLPKHAQSIWVSAFNSCYADKHDDASCSRIAWGAVKKKYHKNAQGTWVEEMHMDILLAVEGLKVLTVAEEGVANAGLFRYEGTALVDDVISSNDRYYSRGSNDAIMKATNTFMEAGGVVTVYSRHGKAMTNPITGQLPTGLPVGRLSRPLRRDGNKVKYEAVLVPTTDGRDAQIVVENSVVKGSSIRTTQYTSRPGKIGDRDVDIMETAVIQGIDLADIAGIAGAGIDKVFEEAPDLQERTQNGEEDDTMDWKDVTLEQLLKERPDLLTEHAKTLTALEGFVASAAHEDALAKLRDQVVSMTDALAEAKSTSTDAAGIQHTLKLAEASLMGASKQLYESLKTKAPKSADLTDALIEEVRTTVLNETLAELGIGGKDPTSAKGNTHEEDPAGDNGTALEEEQEHILRIMGAGEVITESK